jgi:RHS repeat-associated protein
MFPSPKNTAFSTYTFGSIMVSVSKGEYRYGFQNQEKDEEIRGDGNSLNFTLRMYDSRIGRFFAVDPLAVKFAWFSPYVFSENKVLENRELEGGETINSTWYATENRGYVMVLQMSNPPGPLVINRAVVAANGTVGAGTRINTITTNSASTPEGSLLGSGGHHWSSSNTRNSFFNTTSYSQGENPYSNFRPILWKSTNDGKIENPPVQQTNTINRRGRMRNVGNQPTLARVARQIGLIQPFIDNAQRNVNNINNNPQPIVPIDQNSNATIATIAHPDFAGAIITVNQNTRTVGQTQITSAGNIVVNITGNTANAAEINATVAGLQARNTNAIFRTVFDNSTVAAGSYNVTVSYDQTSTTQTSTTTTSTANDSSTGRNIPQGN